MQTLFYAACMLLVFVNGVLVGGYLAGLGITARTFRPSWTWIIVDSGFAVWCAWRAHGKIQLTATASAPTLTGE